MKWFRRRSDGCEDAPREQGHPRKISIVARWDFEVSDPDKVMAAVKARLVAKGYTPDSAADHVRDVEMALLMLYEIDGWEPAYESIGLEFAGAAANTRAIEKTLEEGDDAMDADF